MSKSNRIKKWGAVAVGAIAAVSVLSFIVVAQGRKAKEVGEQALSESREKIRQIYTEEYQEQARQQLEERKESQEYTEDHMLIQENPFGTNTLSLYVYFTTAEPATVSYQVSAEDESAGDFSGIPEGENDYNQEHEFQVIGLLPDQKNVITFTVTAESGEERTYRQEYEMGSLLGGEEVQLERSGQEEALAESSVSNGLYVILGNDSDGLDFMYYYDNQGVLRGEVPLIGYRSHRLLFQNGRMYYSISQTKIAAVNSLGQVEQVYDTKDYILHHDYVFDDEGDLLVLATDTQSDSVEDQILLLDDETGEITMEFDLGDLLGDYKQSCTRSPDEELDWMHINSIQWLGDETVILSSRETSSILKISGLYSDPQIDYLIGEESFWEGTGYEGLLLKKNEEEGSFSNTGGQHTVTYESDEALPEGQYYLYQFNNNLGVSESQPEYDWSQIQGIATSLSAGENSYYYKYKVDESTGTYSLVQSFSVPFSGYVSSVQDYQGNIIVDSGMEGVFGEYDAQGNLLRDFKMNLSKSYIYRVYKYHFEGFYFEN